MIYVKCILVVVCAGLANPTPNPGSFTEEWPPELVSVCEVRQGIFLINCAANTGNETYLVQNGQRIETYTGFDFSIRLNSAGRFGLLDSRGRFIEYEVSDSTSKEKRLVQPVDSREIVLSGASIRVDAAGKVIRPTLASACNTNDPNSLVLAID